LYTSTVNGNGRAFAQYSIAEQEKYYPTLIRFGREFQQDTTVNELNRFLFDSQDTYDRSNGDVRKMHVEGRSLYVFQKFDIGVVPILTQVVRDTTGNPLEANSDILLNKIQYPYKGKFGIGDCPESFAYYKYAKYFVDSNRGLICRLSQDGVTVLSVVYDVNGFVVPIATKFKKELNTGIAPTGGVYTGNPTIYGAFDYYTNKYIIAFEEINRYSSPSVLAFHQDPYTMVFYDTQSPLQGFETFMSCYAEGFDSLNTVLVSFKNGGIWVHDSTVFCNYFGVQYDASITAVFNTALLQKKTFKAVTEQASTVWDCPEIVTDMDTYGATLQSSTLLAGNFKKLEGLYHAAFMRDINSRGGRINGKELKGSYIKVKFRVQNASSFVNLNIVSVYYIESQLNNR
jgi:hypothetical protein